MNVFEIVFSFITHFDSVGSLDAQMEARPHLSVTLASNDQ